jgi:hypothetical protein
MVIEQARELLERGGYTCVFVSENETVTSNARGVAPLLELIEQRKSLKGFSAADKVVGAGAAYLYVLLNVESLWAATLSESAKQVLERYGASYSYGELVPHIINRRGDGICPIECAVKNSTSPKEAFEDIKQALAILSRNTQY